MHQLYHNALIAMELSCLDQDYAVFCLSCNEEHTSALNKLSLLYPGNKAKIIRLERLFRYKYLNYKKKSHLSMNDMVRIAKPYLKDADCIVTTSHSTPKMLAKNKITKPLLVYKYHGCGDRRYGFDPLLNKFDYILLPGIYHQTRLIEEKIISMDRTFIVGWPKFDYYLKVQHRGDKLFDNDNPVILYTPHWDPELTSYNRYSEFLLSYFKEHRGYNFIFAPHILIKNRKTKLGYEIEFSRFESDNIVIDFGSEMSSDGTYLNSSDIYIGDVSSMVYEFIAFKPRPCLFLNAHNVDWKNNPDYRFWEYGQVVESFDEFDPKFRDTIMNPGFIDLQKTRIREYFDITDEPSSLRAARAISKIMNCG